MNTILCALLLAGGGEMGAKATLTEPESIALIASLTDTEVELVAEQICTAHGMAVTLDPVLAVLR